MTRNSGKTLHATVFWLGAVALLPFALCAQDGATVNESAETRTASAPTAAARVARLAWFRGDLEVRRADNSASLPTPENPNPETAVVNMPIVEGSRLLTGEDAEAEIEFEDGSVVRLTPRSVLSIDTLSFGGPSGGQSAKTQISLLNGLAYFELRHAPTTSYVVSAGTLLAAPADNVVFRVALDQPPASISVLSGELLVSSDASPDGSEARAGFTATVKAGESLHADLDDVTRYFLSDQLTENTWDAWNQTRDAEATNEGNTRTTARDAYSGAQGYGWSDLDANGTWYSVANADGSTSELWQPAIAADASASDTGEGGNADTQEYADAFDPYGDGAFVYSDGAYLWASSYSWGWLPYRCGRWNYYPLFGWAWTPNRFCSIYGYGGGVGINIGRRPHHYRALQFPPITPVHPILRVHTGEPRPRVPRANAVPVKTATLTATPCSRLPDP